MRKSISTVEVKLVFCYSGANPLKQRAGVTSTASDDFGGPFLSLRLFFTLRRGTLLAERGPGWSSQR